MPSTEVSILADIVASYGSQPVGTTEVPLLQNWVTALGGQPVGTTEVPLLGEILGLISPGTVPGTTEVAILMQIASALGASPVATTEVPLLLEILGVLGSSSSVPVNTVAPVVSPINLVEDMLVSCTTGSWSGNPTSYAYQWLGDGLPIGGATSSTYTVQNSDVGTVLSCEVTASNLAGPSSPAVSNSTNAVLADSSYLRPGGSYTYFRSSGAFLFLRP